MAKLNILQMIGEFTSGGAETMVVTLAGALESNLIKVTVTARQDGPVSGSLPESSVPVIIPKKKVFDAVQQTIKNLNI